MALWGVLFSLIGCVSSEETGAGDRAKTPVQIFGPIDTTRHRVRREVRSDTLAKPKIDSTKLTAAKKPRVAPKFKSRQDTVRASVVVKSKPSSLRRIKIERPEHPFYTVQIGAFGRVANALRAQKKAKERFIDQPVFNNYVKGAKVYRVSIGRYENRKEAFALSDTMKLKFSQEYRQCWINFIP
jgi:septal ring-binding cell division protein DamX